MSKPTMIFVFGSNLSGHHGRGAAATAYKHHGARWSQGAGLMGGSYGIPTKDRNIRDSLPLGEIKRYVDQFLDFAKTTPETGYQVTRIGCGLAGFWDAEIAPMFQGAPVKNCFFDSKWRPWLGLEVEYWGTY